MMRVKNSQIACIEAAALRRWARAKAAALAAQDRALDGEAERLLEQAQRDGEALDLGGSASLERYVDLSLGLSAEMLDTPWGAMATHVLCNDAQSAAARLDFIERHLLPRMRGRA